MDRNHGFATVISHRRLHPRGRVQAIMEAIYLAQVQALKVPKHVGNLQ